MIHTWVVMMIKKKIDNEAFKPERLVHNNNRDWGRS